MRHIAATLIAATVLSFASASGTLASDETPTGGCPSVDALGFSAVVRTDTATATVVERVTRAKVTQAQARRITMMNPVLSLVTVSGRTLRVIPGNSMWKLSNGGFAIFDSEPTPDAMQVWTKDMGDGDLYVRACLCPGYNPNVDDGCKFSDPGNPTNPGTCGGNTCCGLLEGVILGDGTPVVF
jgi:hypothetical protein